MLIVSCIAANVFTTVLRVLFSQSLHLLVEVLVPWHLILLQPMLHLTFCLQVYFTCIAALHAKKYTNNDRVIIVTLKNI